MDRDINDVLQNWLWSRLLGNPNCASYDGAVDLDVLNVIQLIAEAGIDVLFYTKIADKLGLKPEYVELVQFMLCGAGYAEYGTSPRGCWITRQGERFYKRLKPYHDYLRSE